MAEGLLRHDAGDRFAVESAGSAATSVRTEAVAVMRELGIDISRHRSKSVETFAGQSFDLVLTVCDNAKEACPVFPGHGRRLHHAFPDPTSARGSEADRLHAFRVVRDQIRTFLRQFAAEHGVVDLPSR